MKKAKTALASALILIICAAILCACGSKSSFDGKWSCVKIPAKMGFSEVVIEIDGTDFTYTMTGDDTTTVMEGHGKITGSDSMVLYVDSQKQIQNSDKTVINEKVMEASESESQPVDVKLEKSGNLTLSGGTTKLEFKKG